MQNWLYEPVTDRYEALLFYNTMQRHPDVYYYNPIAVARREEFGMKYRFLCIGSPKSNPGIPSHFADIEIYKPYSGRPYATGLYKMKFDSIFPHRLPY